MGHRNALGPHRLFIGVSRADADVDEVPGRDRHGAIRCRHLDVGLRASEQVADDGFETNDLLEDLQPPRLVGCEVLRPEFVI